MIPNPNLIPVNEAEVEGLVEQIANDLNRSMIEWYTDPDRPEAEKEAGKPLSEMTVEEAAYYGLISRHLLEYDTTIVPDVGIKPKPGTKDFYLYMNTVRWKKPLKVVVAIFPCRPGSDECDAKKGRYNRKAKQITIYLPRKEKVGNIRKPLGDRASVRRRIKSTLLHEMTHAMDPDLRHKGLEYGERPSEIRATARQVADDVREYLAVRHSSLGGASPSDRFWLAVEASKNWRKAKKRHSEDGQRKILEYTYTEASKRGLLG